MNKVEAYKAFSAWLRFGHDAIEQTNSDGSIDVYFSPLSPEGKTSNWIQTAPGKGFFTILRLYNPLQPFFDKTWRPSEITPYEAS